MCFDQIDQIGWTDCDPLSQTTSGGDHPCFMS